MGEKQAVSRSSYMVALTGGIAPVGIVTGIAGIVIGVLLKG